MALRIIQLINLRPLTLSTKSIFNQSNLYSSRQTTQLLFAPRNQLSRFHRKNVNSIGRPTAEGGSGNGTNSSLLKPILFTFGFSASVFVGTTIWEYEKILARTKAALRTPFSSLRDSESVSELKRAWASAPPGLRFFIPICAINLVVFGLWHLPQLKLIMGRYFLTNPASKAICWPMFLSTFSHQSTVHIFCNMFVLYSFSNPICSTLGKEQATAVYLTGGVVASLASLLGKIVTRTGGGSLGASGAIMAVLAYHCTKWPDTQLSIIFLPMFMFSAGMAIKAVIAFDVAGCVLGWKIFDHMAHLGGALFGIFWFYVGEKQLWPKRRFVFEQWHKFRSNF